MSPNPHPHDSLFRTILGEPARAAAALRAVLPAEVLGELDLETLSARPESFLDEALRSSCADLLFTVGLRDGGSGFVYVLLEHQSSPDPRMPMRLLQYQARIWERHLADHPDESLVPPIIPVVVHHGPRAWPSRPAFSSILAVPESTRAAFAPRLLDFEFILDDLARLTDAQILARGGDAILRLVLIALRNSRIEPRLFERVLDAMVALRDDLRGPSVIPALARLASYVLEVSEEPPQAIRAAFTAALSPEIRSSVMSTADMLRAEGRLEGEVEARRKDLLDLIEIRFGSIPDAARTRIETATNEQLVRWLRRFVLAPTIEAVLDA